MIKNLLISLIAIFFYFLPLSGLFGKRLFRHLPKTEQKFWGFMSLLASLIVWSTVSYYAYQINLLSALLILISPLFSLSILKGFSSNLAKNSDLEENLDFAPKKNSWLLLLPIAIDAYLFYTLWLGRTAALLPSPWQAVEAWFFILYGLSSILIFFGTVKSRPGRLTYLANIAHFFLIFSVAAIIYQLGFGFDAFIHRATEDWILKYGFILPKSPYYIGQYSFVVWLTKLTGWPLHAIDIWLVPVLASIIIPISIAQAAKQFYNIPTKFGLIFSYIIPFVPFFSFQLTTPYNLALLFSFVLVAASASYLKGQQNAWLLILMALATLCIHPILGAPMLIFTLTIIFCKNKFSVLRASLAGLSLALVLPILFTLNNWRVGAGLPKLINPLANLNNFRELFARPYWYAQQTPWKYEILYAWERLIVPMFVGLAAFSARGGSASGGGFFNFFKRRNDALKKFWLFPLASITMIVSAFILRTLIIFPDVVSYEQGDYPLRLLKFSLMFLLPLVIVGLYEILLILQKHKYHKQFLTDLAIGASLILMFSFYFSYPQRNIKARFPGYNVTGAHLETVKLIHGHEPEYNYIVLADQLTSAAALSEYSFAKYYDTPNGKIFYYSIPTGGKLYEQYGHMIYEGQKREFMDTAMDLAGVNKAYFVVNSYWANYQNIIEGAKKTADSWQEIDGGKSWVFVYIQPSTK